MSTTFTDLLADCVHCGFCLPACPTYASWGDEMDSPRGRIDLMKGLDEGTIALDARVVSHFDQCLGCMGCVTACPSGVRYDLLIESTRAKVEKQYTRAPGDRIFRALIFALFPYPWRLRLAAIPLRLYVRSGLQRLVRTLGLAKRLPPGLAQLEALSPPATAETKLRAFYPARTRVARKRIALVAGCVQRVFFSGVNDATIRVLNAEGCDVVVPTKQGCCGALSLHSGRDAEAKRLAWALIEEIERERYDAVIINAAGCGSTLKSYGELFAGDESRRTRAQRFAERVQDVSEFLAELEPIAPRSPMTMRVAYHDACHLAHAQRIRQQPRDLLTAIPGLELVEIPDGEQCCGSAGTYNLFQPASANEIGERKVESVLATNADLLASANPGCTLQISSLLRKRNITLQAAHPIEILDASICGTPLTAATPSRQFRTSALWCFVSLLMWLVASTANAAASVSRGPEVTAIPAAPSPSAPPPATPTASAPLPTTPPVPPAIEPRIRVLPDGLRVVVVEDHLAPIAHVTTWYRFGSAYEHAGKTGLAHGLEHMMFRGTPTLSAAGLDDINAELGADVNAQTGKEATTYSFVVPADRVGLALRIEADRMVHLSLSPQDWSVEKKAVLHEWDQDHNNVFYSVITDIDAEMFSHHAIGRSPLGDRDDVASSSVADLRQYYRAWYAPNNATIVITGDVDADAVFAQATSAFHDVPARKLPSLPDLAATPVAHGKLVHELSESPIEIDDLAYALPPSLPGRERETLASAIFVLALDNPRSPLRAALVDSGLALAYFVLPSFDRHASIAHAFVIVTPGRNGESVRAAFQTAIASMAAKGLSDDIFTAAKRLLVAQEDFARDNLPLYALSSGQRFAFPDTISSNQSRELLSTISLADVDAAAKHRFAEPNVIGVINARGRDLSKIKPPSAITGTIADSFAQRIPSGKVVEPRAIRASLAKPLAFASTIEPTSFTLSNGLRVLVDENRFVPTVAVVGMVASSPSFAPVGKEGVSELVTSLMNFGSAHYSFDAQHRVADRLGATVAFGQNFSARGYASDLPAMLDVLADDLRSPTLPEDRFSIFHAQSVGTMTALSQLAATRAERALNEALYPAGDPARRTPTASSYAAVSMEDVRAYAARYLRPDLVTIAVVGNVSESDVRSAMESAFGTWTVSGPRPDPALPPIPKPKTVRTYVRSQAAGLTVTLAQRALPRSDPDYDAFMLLNTLFGNGSFDSRLFQELREKRGLVYAISSNVDADLNRATLKIQFSTDAADEEEAIAGVRAVMIRLQKTAISPQELTRAKVKAAAAQLIAEESTASIAAKLLDLARFDLPLGYYKELGRRYDRISVADIQRVAKRVFDPHGLIEIRTGP